MLQFMMIETTGKKVLLLRGYTGMSASMVLLTVTLYFQVRHDEMTFVAFYFIYLFFDK